MKTYTIKPEFLSMWGSKTAENTIVTEREVERLSREWGVSVEDLMGQLEFCEDRRFEIKTDNFEFRFGTSRNSIPVMTSAEILDSYLCENANDPLTVASFDTAEEAKAEFQKHYSTYGSTYAENGVSFWFLRGEIAWIEENSYDEDGDFGQGGTILIYSAEAFGEED